MADKKKQEATKKKINQIIVICACVFFVILMILSGMSSHWLSIFTTVKPGDKVVVDYTIYDATGDPILTSDQALFTKVSGQGKGIIYGRQVSVIAGQNLTKPVYPVLIYVPGSGWTEQFALFSAEYDSIGTATLGMKAGDQKHITITNGSIVQEWSRQQVANKLDVNNMTTGDILTMAVSDNPEEMAANSTNVTTYLRVGALTAKTNASILIDSGYPAADITISAINPTS